MDERTRPSYYRNYNGALAEKIAKRAAAVEDVKDARAVVTGNRVIVAVTTNEENTTRIERLVRQAIAPYTAGK
ncbi:YhcN/YlaJ family sporulation lipoprotein, partial [Salmonella enterica]|uniref:YhcN/YlaJ family sporulation lipoprotein n=1 Tax=Salmonella enterica TaxID=28901 RepID=UPI003CF76AE3